MVKMRKGDFIKISKNKALKDRRVCAICKGFLRTHKLGKDMNPYIGDEYKCSCGIAMLIHKNRIVGVFRVK